MNTAKALLITIAAIFPSLLISAQDPKKEYEADALKDAAMQKEIEPNSKICFDKRVQFKARWGGREVSGCFLINTKFGITGALPVGTGTTPNCQLQVNTKKFQLFVYGMKGNEYTYFNRFEKVRQNDAGQLMHYVRTGNTHKNPLQDVLEAKMLYKKNGTAEFCDGKYKALEYRSEDGKDILYLYGKEFPSELKAYSYLGAYSVGYLKADKGNYLIMQATHGREETRITAFENIEEAMDCFEPAMFKVYEETKLVETIADTEEREQKLARDLAKDKASAESGKYPCAEKKAAFTEEKLKMESKSKELQEKMKNNTIKHSSENDMVELGATYDPIASVRMQRLETEYKLCRLKNDINANRIANNNLSKAIEKSTCWENRVTEYKKLEDGMAAIESRFRNDKKKMIEEKMKYYQQEVMPKIGMSSACK